MKEFGDIEFYQTKKEIKERFEKILTNLRKTVEKNGNAVQIIERFRGCLENPENNDITRLPFYSFNSISRKRKKIHCVLCLTGYTIQIYWSFCVGNKLVKNTIGAGLNKLENYAIKGLDAFKIIGTKYPNGYSLKEI